MSLDLDKRQRAMLREMGIRLWQAPPAVAQALPTAMAATETAATAMVAQTGTRSGELNPMAAAAPVALAASASWALGEARALFSANPGASTSAVAGVAGAARGAGSSARWLVLLETATGQEQADPLAGDVGKLLGNMLRAAGLHQSASATWAPVSRRALAGDEPMLQETLTQCLSAEQPDVVLIMGRLAAQAVLQSSEPLGKLRGQVHQLAGKACVVTYDAAYLLRSLPDKAKAWDDLCRAQQVARQTPRLLNPSD
jgi:DNA polymerase